MTSALIRSLLNARARSVSGSLDMGEIDERLMALGVHAYRSDFDAAAYLAKPEQAFSARLREIHATAHALAVELHDASAEPGHSAVTAAYLFDAAADFRAASQTVFGAICHAIQEPAQ
jgi:hypothetical protein